MQQNWLNLVPRTKNNYLTYNIIIPNKINNDIIITENGNQII